MDRLVLLFVLVAVCWSSIDAKERCKKNDLQRCVYYKAQAKYYCQHAWTKVNCAKMCDLCEYGVVTRPPKAREQLRQQLIIDEKSTGVLTQSSMGNMLQAMQRSGNGRPAMASGKVCAGADHYFCVFFEAGKHYYCTTSWCKTNCKWMCGVCKK